MVSTVQVITVAVKLNFELFLRARTAQVGNTLINKTRHEDNEPHSEKTGFLHMRKRRRRSAAQ